MTAPKIRLASIYSKNLGQCSLYKNVIRLSIRFLLSGFIKKAIPKEKILGNLFQLYNYLKANQYLP